MGALKKTAPQILRGDRNARVTIPDFKRSPGDVNGKKGMFAREYEASEVCRNEFDPRRPSKRGSTVRWGKRCGCPLAAC